MRGLKHKGHPAADLAAWRAECLRRRGFEAGHAELLARDGRYDLHALLELLDRGCPPHLASRILAPLDAQERP